MTCVKCGRLKPQFASGTSSKRSVGDRLLVFEGYAPGGRQFRYTGSEKCLPCRAGTRNLLRDRPRTGDALKAWLVTVNERKDA